MDEEYVATVLDVIDEIPPGRVMTYGDVATAVREVLGRGGPRQVGTALREAGAAVPWWRVVRASGLPAERLIANATTHLREEGCPFSANGRIAMSLARLSPTEVLAIASGSSVR